MNDPFKKAFELSSAKLGAGALSQDVKTQTIRRALHAIGLELHLLSTLQEEGFLHRAIILPKGEVPTTSWKDAAAKTDWVFYDGRKAKKFVPVSGHDLDKIIDTIFNTLKEPMSGYMLYANIGPAEKRLTHALEDRAIRLG